MAQATITLTDSVDENTGEPTTIVRVEFSPPLGDPETRKSPSVYAALRLLEYTANMADKDNVEELEEEDWGQD